MCASAAAISCEYSTNGLFLRIKSAAASSNPFILPVDLFVISALMLSNSCCAASAFPIESIAAKSALRWSRIKAKTSFACVVLLPRNSLRIAFMANLRASRAVSRNAPARGSSGVPTRSAACLLYTRYRTILNNIVFDGFPASI